MEKEPKLYYADALKKATVMQTFRDMLNAYRFLLCTEHHDTSQNCLQLYAKCHLSKERHARAEVSSRIGSSGRGNYTEEELLAETELKMKREYVKQFEIFKDCLGFLESDKFLLFSDIDPQSIYERVIEKATAWYNDEVPYDYEFGLM